MRQITIKYDGQCKRCGEVLVVGAPAMYEKSMGVFCLGHEPKEVEEIRAYRLMKAEAKAERLEGWAEKRERESNATLNHIRERYRGDFAFNTQPGHIPERARVIRREERSFESLEKAERMKEKAENLRNVRVAGDAARRDQAQREKNDATIQKGSKIVDFVFGTGTVMGVFKKSYRIQWDKNGNTWARDKIFVRPASL